MHISCSRITSPIHSSFHLDRYMEWGTGFGGLLLPWQLLGKFLWLPVYICINYLKRFSKMSVAFRSYSFAWINKHWATKTKVHANCHYRLYFSCTVSNLVLGLREVARTHFPNVSSIVGTKPFVFTSWVKWAGISLR